MANHGVLAVGADIDDALLKASYVEEIAQVYYATLMINRGIEPRAISIEELEKWKYPKEINLKRN